jgi:hypothetical protein
MDDLLEQIRAALAPDATDDARAAAANACRSIVSTLEPPPPPNPMTEVANTLRGIPAEQLLDLAIAKLRSALPAGVEVPPVPKLEFHFVPLPKAKP